MARENFTMVMRDFRLAFPGIRVDPIPNIEVDSDFKAMSHNADVVADQQTNKLMETIVLEPLVSLIAVPATKRKFSEGVRVSGRSRVRVECINVVHQSAGGVPA
jgi:hypothetical protein